MNLPEKHPNRHVLQDPSIHQTATLAKYRSTRGILHLALPFVILGAVLCNPIESPVLAKRRSSWLDRPTRDRSRCNGCTG